MGPAFTDALTWVYYRKEHPELLIGPENDKNSGNRIIEYHGPEI